MLKLNRVAKNIIRRTLTEDLGTRGDITTRATVPTAQTGNAVMIAKADGVIAGQFWAQWVFRSLEPGVKYEILASDGTGGTPGTEIARISGAMWALLSGERTALNLMGRASGIATLTRRYVDAVAGTTAKITDTRKTAPGLRLLDKGAVVIGGGVNHRYALYDAFLLKENHIAAIGGIRPAIDACRAFSVHHGRYRIIVEARNRDEFEQCLACRPERILLDNMTPDEVRECILLNNHKVELEASGGINLANVRDYAVTGVDFISIGALTHSVTALDLSQLVLGSGVR